MSELTLEPTEVGDRAVCLRIGGELDLSTLAEAEAALALVEAMGPRRIVLDLRDLELIDSSGLRLVVDAERRARREGRSLVIAAAPGDPVHRLLSLTLIAGRVHLVDHPGVPSAAPVPEGDAA
jgi:anti-sigma B factor antagonist